MAKSLSVITDLRLMWEFQNTLDLATVEDVTTYKERQVLATGAGSEQANDMYHRRIEMTPSPSPPDIVELDIAGDLTNVFGDTINFKRIRQIVIVNKGVPNAGHTEWTLTEGENVLIGGYGGGASAGGWAEMFNLDVDAKLLLRSGGMFVCTAPVEGWRVVEGTEDILAIELSGGGVNDVDVDVILIGIS